MTIKELYDLFDDNCTELNTQGHYTSTDECKAIRMVLDVIKELQAHREAWEKVYTDIEQLTTILYESSCEGDWQYGVDKYDVLDIIDKNRPKEGDAE